MGSTTLRDLRSISDEHSLVLALKIEEDLTEFRYLDEQLLHITQARNTTATGLLEDSDCWSTWRRFRKRDQQRTRDIECLEAYVEFAKVNCSHFNESPSFRLWRETSTAKAARARILQDQNDLLTMLVSVDDIHPGTLSRNDRKIQWLEQKIPASAQAIARNEAEIAQRRQEKEDFDEESRAWGVTAFDRLEYISDSWTANRMLFANKLSLVRQNRCALQELRKQEARRR